MFLGFTIAAGSDTFAGSGNTYTALLTTEELCSWQQDILQAAIPPLCECSQSIGASSFAASLFPEEFVFPCPWAAHMFPVQHAIPRACHAVAHIGAHSIITAIRHTHAPAVFPGAIGAWSERFIM